MQVIPGTLLNITGDVQLGEGLYTKNGQVYASRVGTIVNIKDSENSDSAPLIKVVPTPPSIPSIGQTIIGTVTKLTARYVGIDIQVIDSAPPCYYQEPFKGTLRSQDIWGVDDRDAPTQLYLCFRPGDLVRARIIGVGDASTGFLLSTALSESLGVVYAKAAASGDSLIPISWREMICPKTGIREARKPAKPNE